MAKRYICVRCMQRFHRQYQNEDVSRVSSKESSFFCAKCLTFFSNGYNVVSDIEKPFVCDECQEGFRFECELKNHLYKHTNQWPYKCRLCGRGFPYESLLLVHASTHLEERPFQCSICPLTFRRIDMLDEHMKLHAR